MNPETGQIYRTAEEVEAARKRGEPLVALSEREADRLEGMNRHERRRTAAIERRRRK